jgi:hypothetical protein
MSLLGFSRNLSFATASKDERIERGCISNAYQWC